MATWIVLFSAAVMLLCGVFAHGRARGMRFGLLEIQLLAVALYFSLYTLVDITVNDPIAFDSFIVALMMALVILATFLTALLGNALFARAIDATSLANMSRRWLETSGTFVVLIAFLIFAFNVYLYLEYGILLVSFNEAELELLGVTFPSWLASARLVFEGLGFGVFLFSVATLVAKRRASRLRQWALLIFAVLLFSLGGRRSLMNLAVVGLAMFSISRSRHLYSIRNLILAVVATVLLVLFSNSYQTYRGESIANAGDFSALPPVTEAMMNFEATAENLRVRAAMWKFNYLISSRQVVEDFPPTWGKVFTQGLQNSVPSLLWPGKEVVDTDELIANAYRLPVQDYPTNNFATLQTDFGPGMVLLVPFFTLLPIAALSLLPRAWPELYLFACGLTLRLLINIENAPGDIYILARDVAIVALLFAVVRGIRTIMPRLTDTHQRQAPASC